MRSVTSLVFQFPITFLEIIYQFAFQVLQVADLVPNLGKFRAQQIPDFPTGMSTTVSRIEELFDFLQGEAESLHLLNKSESRYVVCCIETKLSHCPGCSRQHCLALVEPNRVDAQLGPLRGLADLNSVRQGF